MGWYGWRPYVPVAARRAQALKKLKQLEKKGLHVKPVRLEGKRIAQTFWGEAWCDHLESFSDYENRLPRGRTYVRNGSVCHLEIAKGKISAMVSGSELYRVEIAIKPLAREKWKQVKARCAGQIGSLLELLEGKLSRNVMKVVTDRNDGLFPLPRDIRLACDCPDWAVMCKHVAAVLYGVGARLDEKPELLFLLRGVDHEELLGAKLDMAATTEEGKPGRRRIADEALADVFGIELSEHAASDEQQLTRRRNKSTPKFRKSSKVAVKDTPTRKTTIRISTSLAGKTRSARQPAAKVSLRSRPTDQFVTARAVAALRKKFAMSHSQFAQLLGVCTASIANWEMKTGRLNLQSRTLDAWNMASKLAKKQAWHKLSDL